MRPLLLDCLGLVALGVATLWPLFIP